MKRTLTQAALVLVGLSLAIATASVKLPRGGISGEPGPNGCPTALLDGTIESINTAGSQFTFLPKGGDEAVAMRVDSETAYRIPGLKKDELKTNGLSKIPDSAPAKIRFCTDDGRVIEVKVKKEKKKSQT
ncbi:MAG: hypothetical protein O2968_15900 [Acidobacteria bacterium]|nr:hypothetical protein [Acidobacteriota bacterium]